MFNNRVPKSRNERKNPQSIYLSEEEQKREFEKQAEEKRKEK